MEDFYLIGKVKANNFKWSKISFSLREFILQGGQVLIFNNSNK